MYSHELFPLLPHHPSPQGQLIFYPVVSEMENLFFLNLRSKLLKDKATVSLAQQH